MSEDNKEIRQRDEVYKNKIESSLLTLGLLLDNLNDIFSYRFDESVNDRMKNRRLNINFKRMKTAIEDIRLDLISKDV
jgi:hypothetical protein